MRSLAVRAFQVAHVLHQAEDGHAHLLEHVNGFARVFQRDFRRRGDDHGAGERRGLNERELHVAGSGRQIDNQIIELAPIDAAQELLNHAVQHGPAPDQRLVAGIQEAHGHDAHAVFFERLDALADGVRLGADAHHERHVGTVDIGVEQAHFVAQARQRDGQIHRNGGFSDAAFARSDGDQILDAGDRNFRLFGLRCVGTHQFDVRSSGRS